MFYGLGFGDDDFDGKGFHDDGFDYGCNSGDDCDW